jgi:hypothetical protein
MDRILFIVGIVLLYSSPSLAVDEGQVAYGFPNNLLTYHQDGINEKKPIPWEGKYGQLTKNLTTGGNLIDDSLDRYRSSSETSIGPRIAPLFGTYSVLRTSGKQNGSSYVALGLNLDELTKDEADTSYSSNDSDLSFGFGIDNKLFNIEYMMYVDEGNYEISAISLGYISEF